MSSLISYLKQVKDWRDRSGQRHPLWWVLFIVILGLMMGNLSYRDLAAFGKNKHYYLTRLGKSPKLKSPSYSTIRRAMMGVDNNDLIQVFNQWAAQLSSPDELSNWIAIDGKSIKSTLTDTYGNKQNFASIVSWFSQDNGLVLALEKLENKKTSEIYCVREMVNNTPLSNQVLTLDAVHCQKETIKTINRSRNDYVIAVKKNQPKLYNRLEEIAHNQISDQEDIRTETSHGRQVTRTVSVFRIPETLQEIWISSQCFIKVERKGTRKNKPYHQIVYYLSSCYQTAQNFSKKIQGHWGIENQLHWVKDVIFSEDVSPVHHLQSAVNFSVLKTICLNLFRLLGFLSVTEARRWLGERLWLLPILIE
ncbi:ISAs1 family transposase [Dactylococcopsis salina]|nr:ISAs1 family transposase [Dactylococcopsis salina]AFZ49061.1 transposase [Dactylococcopsis salina PCC 8305]AFZ49953.1 transposase [Dactylococcopsis salina PCC 8305]AFZ49956.1 transposase [Dactylococcopsis salina PCC 8305]AFZ51232.1 transposase [Dactylococcopsis salina PCC 8305]AFZ51650.1 transposase [Dactylococcopsis salina PCC 8305]